MPYDLPDVYRDEDYPQYPPVRAHESEPPVLDDRTCGHSLVLPTCGECKALVAARASARLLRGKLNEGRTDAV